MNACQQDGGPRSSSHPLGGPGDEPNARALQRDPARDERKTRGPVRLDVYRGHVVRREFELAGLASSAELRWVR
jgi:hypothetical protein